MNVLGISGSPQVNGNTAYAVKHALEIIEKKGFTTQYLSLAGREIQPCVACWQCEETRECFIEDDMAEILDALRICDGLIIGSPVYFGMVTGQLKTMMDRCIVLRPNYGGEIELAGKVAGGIACGASRNGGQEITLQNIQTFILQNNMLAISDGPDFCHSGGTIVGEAEQDEWGLKTIRNLALNLVNALCSEKS